MFRWIFYVLVAVLVAALLTVFISVSEETRAPLGQEFALSIGQVVFIQDEELSVRFTSVTEDSRCPRGATCVWEGRVSCLVQLTDETSSSPMLLTAPGLTEQYSEEQFKEYHLLFQVTPYPEIDKQIAEKLYRLLMVVSR